MINGRRRDHGAERAHLDVLEAGAPVKCNPLAWWEFKDCWDYIDKQGLQYHPLHDEVSCLSIGCYVQLSTPDDVSSEQRMLVLISMPKPPLF